MKKRILLVLLCASMLLTLCACAAERYDLLYQTEVDSLTFCVRGRGTRAKQIVVKSGSDLIFSAKVKVAKDVGTMGGTYGFEVLDLNFDGKQDMMIADAKGGEEVSYICWLWNAESGSYERSESLSGLCNIQTNKELEAVFAFSHTYADEKAYEDAPASHTVTDASTKYIWKDGLLIPSIRVSMIYYSESNLYCYSVAYYDEQTKAFVDSGDKWLTPEEYATYDLSFLYYFK